MFISTPNLRLKRVISEHFLVYNIDEFRTSMLNHKTETKCENLYAKDKKNNMRKQHSILTFIAENNRKEYVNRDNNAVNNMIKIVKYYLKTKKRPERFERTFKLEVNKNIS